jgi:hypothetical protein
MNSSTKLPNIILIQQHFGVNMKTLITTIALATSILSLSAQAQPFLFKPVDDNIATELCIAAVKEGVTSALNSINVPGVNKRELAETISCNGYRLDEFADKYHTVQKTSSPGINSKKIKLVAAPGDASIACIDAITLGVDKALAKHNSTGYNVTCNGESINVFVRAFKGLTNLTF